MGGCLERDGIGECWNVKKGGNVNGKYLNHGKVITSKKTSCVRSECMRKDVCNQESLSLQLGEGFHVISSKHYRITKPTWLLLHKYVSQIT